MRKLICAMLVIVILACSGIAYGGATYTNANHNMATDYTMSSNYGLFIHEYHIGSVENSTIKGSYSNARIKTSSYIIANVIMKVTGIDKVSVTKNETPQARIYNGGSGRTNTLYAYYMYGYMDIRGGANGTGGDVYSCELGVEQD